jgi:DNA-directed RNA polymerase subunit RPC12/RpoP
LKKNTHRRESARRGISPRPIPKAGEGEKHMKNPEQKETYKGVTIEIYKRDNGKYYTISDHDYPQTPLWGVDDSGYDPHEYAESYATPDAATAAERKRIDAREETRTQWTDTTFDENEAREKKMVVYTCHECGAEFFANWRSAYSPNPPCPGCGETEMMSWSIIPKA